MEKIELPKNKTNREVLNEEYFAKAAPAVYEAISNAYREGYHTGWMRAAKFYTKKYKPDEVEENAKSADLSKMTMLKRKMTILKQADMSHRWKGASRC